MTTATSAPAASPYQLAAGPVTSARRRALGLLAGAGIVPALPVLVVVLLVVGPIPGLAAGAVVWALAGLGLIRSSTQLVLGGFPAMPADPDRHARLHNLTESLCAASGLPKPTLMVVEETRPNSLSLGLNASSATVVVTSGLAEAFTRLEMEAVLAHELSHVRRGDTAVGTAVAVVLKPLLAFAPHLSVRLADRILGDAEACADVAAVGLTRYPPALVSALGKMSAPPTGDNQLARSVDLLWNAPLGSDAVTAIESRIEALLEL